MSVNSLSILGTVKVVRDEPKFLEVELSLPKEKKSGGFAETKVKFVGGPAQEWARQLNEGHIVLLQDVDFSGFRTDKGLFVSLTCFKPGLYIWVGGK